MRLLPAGLMLLAAACGARVADVARAPEAAAVAVRLDSTGRWQEARFVPPGASVALEAGEGALLVVFELSPDAVLGLDGARLSSPALARLEVEAAGASDALGCGRCRVPGGRALRLGPGDACPLPRPAPGRVLRMVGEDARPTEDPLLLDAIRSRVRVSRPGPCPEGASETPLGMGAVCGLSPPEAPVRAQRVAVGPGGSVVAARGGFAAFVGPRGAGVTVPLPGAFLGDLEPPEERGDPFLLAVGGLVLLDLSAGLREHPLPPPMADARGLARLEPGFVHVFGADADGGPAVARCAIAPGGGVGPCIAERIRCAAPNGRPLVDGVSTSRGGLAVGLEGRVYRRSGRGRWRCDPRARIQLDGQAGFRPTRVEEIAHLGDRLFVCADGFLDGQPGAVGVLTTSTAEDLWALEVADASFGLACNGFVRPPDTEDALLSLGVLGGGALFGAEGELRARCDASLACVPEVNEGFGDAAPHGIVHLAAGRLDAAALDFSGRIHRRARGARSAQIVYGEPEAPLAPASALATREGEAWVFDGALAPRRLEVPGEGCAGFRLERARPEGGWRLEAEGGSRSTGDVYPGSWRDRARAAAWTGEAFVVGGERFGASEAWIRRVDPERGRVQARALPEAQTPVALAPLPGGRALWVTPRALFLVEPGRLDLVPVEAVWEDPAAAPLEPGPAGGAWRGATEAEGVVWVYGEGRVARIGLRPSGGAIAEAWWSFVPGPGSDGASRDVWTAAALAPDRLLTLERVYAFDGRARLRFGLLAPACAGRDRALGYCLDGPRLDALTERRPEVPGAMTAHAGGVTFTTFVSGVALRVGLPSGFGASLDDLTDPSPGAEAAAGATFLPFGFVDASAPFDGGLLLAGRGALAALRLEAP